LRRGSLSLIVLTESVRMQAMPCFKASPKLFPTERRAKGPQAKKSNKWSCKVSADLVGGTMA
jgi:hypothetical protein